MISKNSLLSTWIWIYHVSGLLAVLIILPLKKESKQARNIFFFILVISYHYPICLLIFCSSSDCNSRSRKKGNDFLITHASLDLKDTVPNLLFWSGLLFLTQTFMSTRKQNGMCLYWGKSFMSYLFQWPLSPYYHPSAKYLVHWRLLLLWSQILTTIPVSSIQGFI